jgi:hypothetical protein
MDHKGSIRNEDGPCELKIELHVPRRDIENFHESSADHHSSTYLASAVGVEDRITDDKCSFINVDCPSVLKVVCGAPRHGRKFRGILETIIHPLTSSAVLVSKDELWMARVPSRM